MALKALKVICCVVAGYFILMVGMIGFFVAPTTKVKLIIMGGFSAPALIMLLIGFALDGFRHKLRDTAIVLLSAAGLEAFLVFSYACLFASDDFKKMMKPEMIAQFGDYPTGFVFLAAIVVLGLIALWREKRKLRQEPDAAPLSGPPPARPELHFP